MGSITQIKLHNLGKTLLTFNFTVKGFLNNDQQELRSKNSDFIFHTNGGRFVNVIHIQELIVQH